MIHEPTQAINKISRKNRKCSPFFLALFTFSFSVFSLCVEAYTPQELDSVRTEKNRKLLQIREAQVSEFKEALSRRLPQNRQVDLYVRLSELYMELYQQFFLEEAGVHDKKLARGEKETFIDRSFSRTYLMRGIGVCKEVIQSQVKHPKLDQVYYFLGVFYDEVEDEARAIDSFKTLAERFPNSAYAPEALRILGESAYQRMDYRNAKIFFDRALPKYSAANKPKLLHRKAWTEYRLKNNAAAIESLKQILKESSKSLAGDSDIFQREEIFRDLAVFLSETLSPKEAVTQLQDLGAKGKDLYKAIDTLSMSYERNAKPDYAFESLELFLKQVGTDQRDEQDYARLRLFELGLKSVLNQSRGSEGLIGLKFKKGSELETRYRAAISRLRNQAIKEHERFRKTQDRRSLQNAANLYRSYLTIFAGPQLNGSSSSDRNEAISEADSLEVTMYLAEVETLLGHHLEAGVLYKSVAESNNEKLSREASKLWLKSLGEYVKVHKTDAVSKSFEEAALFVSRKHEGNIEGYQAMLLLAQLYAENPGSRSESEKWIRRLVEDHPETPQAHVAGMLQIQMLQDDLKRLTANTGADLSKRENVKRQIALKIREYRSNRALKEKDSKSYQGELHDAMLALEQDLQIKELKTLLAAKNYAAAAQSLELIGDKAKSDKEREKSYQGAVTQYSESNQFLSAGRVLKKWQKALPKSNLCLESARTSGTRAMIVGDFEAAAKFFSFIGENGDASALELAGRLFEGVGDLTKASDVFKLYIDKFKNGQNRGEVLLSLAQWFEFSNKDSKSIVEYERCFLEQSAQSPECASRLADVYVRLAMLDKSAQWLKKAASLKSNSPWVGYARFQIARQKEEQHKFRFPLRLPEDKLKLALEERVKFIEQLGKDYSTVVESSGPWSVAALYRLGQSVLEFADEIDRIESPINRSQFKDMLKSISEPLRARAYESFQQAFQKSLKDELFSPVMADLANALYDLDRSGATKRASWLLQGARDRYRLSGEPADGSESGGRDLAFSKVRKALIYNAKDASAWIDYGNLLWGAGKPLLAKIAYERSLSLNPRAAAALNNRGVIVLSGYGQEDWIRTFEANTFFKESLKRDDLFLAARFNRASLLSYYRLFERSETLWAQVNAVVQDEDAFDGLGLAEAFRGDWARGDQLLRKADARGASTERFSKVVFKASEALALSKGRSSCRSELEKTNGANLVGFEKTARDQISRACEQSERK